MTGTEKGIAPKLPMIRAQSTVLVNRFMELFAQ